mgnify:CR=1 FL=1
MINYVDAQDGGIKMFYGEDDFVFGTTPEQLAKHIKEIGLADTLMGGSSMDFASEEGFDTDDGAQLLLKRAFELI